MSGSSNHSLAGRPGQNKMGKFVGFILLSGALFHSCLAQQTSTYITQLSSVVPVRIECSQTDGGLKCVPVLQDLCKEQWDFANPCTPANLAVNKTKFFHPHDNTKYLMCDENGKLFVVQCPKYETYHRGCLQCVGENSPLTASCERPLTPLVSNPCTRENVLADRMFFGFPGNLNKFIHCDIWGKAWERTCAAKEVWNQLDTSCVDPLQMNPCTRLNADRSLLYQHPCDPVKYLQCDTFGDVYEITCPSSSIFNVANQRCQPVNAAKGSGTESFCGKYVFSFKSYSYPSSGGRVDLSMFTRRDAIATEGFVIGSGSTVDTSRSQGSAAIATMNIAPFRGSGATLERQSAGSRVSTFDASAGETTGTTGGGFSVAGGQVSTGTSSRASMAGTQGVTLDASMKGGASDVSLENLVRTSEREARTSMKAATESGTGVRMDARHGVGASSGTSLGSVDSVSMAEGKMDVSMARGATADTGVRGGASRTFGGGPNMDKGMRVGQQNAGGASMGMEAGGGIMGEGSMRGDQQQAMDQRSSMTVSFKGSKRDSTMSGGAKMDTDLGRGVQGRSGMDTNMGDRTAGVGGVNFVDTGMTVGQQDTGMSQSTNMGVRFRGSKTGGSLSSGNSMDTGFAGSIMGEVSVGDGSHTGSGQQSSRMGVHFKSSETKSSMGGRTTTGTVTGGGATMDSGMVDTSVSQMKSPEVSSGMKHSSAGGKETFNTVVFADKSIGDQSAVFDSFFGSRNAAAGGVNVDIRQATDTGSMSGSAGTQGAGPAPLVGGGPREVSRNAAAGGVSLDIQTIGTGSGQGSTGSASTHGQGKKEVGVSFGVTKDQQAGAKGTVFDVSLTDQGGAAAGMGNQGSTGGSAGDMTGTFKTHSFAFKSQTSGNLEPGPGDVANRLKTLIQRFQETVGQGGSASAGTGGTVIGAGGSIGGETNTMVGESSTLGDLVKLVGQVTGGEVTGTVSSNVFQGSSPGSSTRETQTVVVKGLTTGGASDVVAKSSSTGEAAGGTHTVVVQSSSRGSAAGGGTQGLESSTVHIGYEFNPRAKFTAPCTRDNINAGKMYHPFKGNRQKFIQCDSYGRMYLMPCNRHDYFDASASICVDGPLELDSIINARFSRNLPHMP